MTGVMTADVNERTRLSSYRFVAAMVAQFVVGGFTLPLVAKFGQGDSARGWQMTMGLWAAVCVVLFLITFLTTRERIQPDPGQKMSVREDFRGLLKNGPWIAMFILTFAHFIVLAMRGGTMYYYFNYYIEPAGLNDLLGKVGLAASAEGAGPEGLWRSLLGTFGLIVNPDRSNAASVGFSLFNMSSQVVTLIGVLGSAALSIRFGKRAVALAGFSLTTVFMALFILLPSAAVGATFLLEYVRALAYAPTVPLLWAMFADVVDYAEWKTGRRATGIVYATIIFALKAGLSMGGALAGWILSGYGYRANAVQTPETLLGIRMTVSVYPAVFFCVVVACLFFYSIDKKLNLRIQDELLERRKRFQKA
jgi:Na+/melibiose symporter-like transporter